MADKPNACCRVEDNLACPKAPNDDTPELTMRVCQVCGSRHFILKADPGKFGLQGATLGG